MTIFMISYLISVRNKLLGKLASNRAQISTLDTILSLFWLTLRDWIFFKGLTFLLCRQQDLNAILLWERMWALKSYNCERCGSDFISGRALKYHFQQKHLGEVHHENCDQVVLRETQQGHSEVQGVKVGGGRRGPPPFPKMLTLWVCCLCFFHSLMKIYSQKTER